MPPRRTTTDALEIIHRRFYAGRPHRLAQLHEAIANDDVARKIYALRTQANLTQRQLARRVGTTPSVISRLEDADYRGHSLAMLNRIAAALNKRVSINFVPLPQKRKSARRSAVSPSHSSPRPSSAPLRLGG